MSRRSLALKSLKIRVVQEDVGGNMSQIVGERSLEITYRSCKQKCVSEVMDEYLTDFNNLDEAATVTIHLARFQMETSLNETCVSGNKTKRIISQKGLSIYELFA